MFWQLPFFTFSFGIYIAPTWTIIESPFLVYKNSTQEAGIFSHFYTLLMLSVNGWNGDCCHLNFKPEGGPQKYEMDHPLAKLHLYM